MKELTQSWKEILLWLLGLRRRFRVTGASMLPVLKAGDEVLIDLHAYKQQRPCVGDIVVLFHPSLPEQKIIKRITDVDEDGRYHVQGDNTAASTDSRHFGWVSLELIIGRVTGRFF